VSAGDSVGDGGPDARTADRIRALLAASEDRKLSFRERLTGCLQHPGNSTARYYAREALSSKLRELDQ
jgi:hypothetical protein